MKRRHHDGSIRGRGSSRHNHSTAVGTPTRPQPNDQADPILAHVLSQLRPFQREAFDFCVHGKVAPPRAQQQPSSSTTKAGVPSGVERTPSAAASGNTSTHDTDSLALAGAGTGRILLADEVCIHVDVLN